jgi:hypothetical protein
MVWSSTIVARDKVVITTKCLKLHPVSHNIYLAKLIGYTDARKLSEKVHHHIIHEDYRSEVLKLSK